MKTFWFLLTIITLLWYIFVTLFVSYKGIADIKSMLNRLTEKNNEND
jgi:uncharacterized membrane protein (DUF485 family)